MQTCWCAESKRQWFSTAAVLSQPEGGNLGRRKKKQKEENWGNIYRGALPLLDDLLARNGWKIQEEKTSSGEEEWGDINIIRDTGNGTKPKQNLTWRMLLTWGLWKVKAGRAASAVVEVFAFTCQNRLIPHINVLLWFIPPHPHLRPREDFQKK